MDLSLPTEYHRKIKKVYHLVRDALLKWYYLAAPTNFTCLDPPFKVFIFISIVYWYYISFVKQPSLKSDRGIFSSTVKDKQKTKPIITETAGTEQN